MGNNSSNTTSVQQSFVNDVIQNNQQLCESTSVQISDNTTIIANGVNVKGNFIGVQLGTQTTADCLVQSQMSSTINNILKSISEQQNKANTDLFNDFTVNSSTNNYNVTQAVQNNISQINESLCDASDIQTTNNTYIYVSGTIDGNFIGVTTSTTPKASCIMTNTMKNATYNSAQSSSKQLNKITGMFAGLLAAIGLVIALVIGLIIFAVVFKIIFSSKDKNQQYPQVEYPPPVSVPYVQGAPQEPSQSLRQQEIVNQFVNQLTQNLSPSPSREIPLPTTRIPFPTTGTSFRK